MWAPIFVENKENVLEALNGYIENLQDFKKMIENDDRTSLKTTMDDTNYIKKIL
jgi:prephenate dehydrogenase